MKPAERPSADGAAAGADVEVVPSGEALRIASGWLGMSTEEALQEAGPSAMSQAGVPAKRPQFLGLGAKYIPHHKAVETASALDSKLRKRLERGLAARRLAEEDEQEEARGGAGTSIRASRPPSRGGLTGPQVHQGGKGSAAGKRPAADLKDTAGGLYDTDSDDEERKAIAVIGKAGAGAKATTGSGAGVALGSKAAREAALLYTPVDGGGGKSKRGKGNKRQRAAWHTEGSSE